MGTFIKRFLVVIGLAAETTLVSWPALAAQRRADLVVDAIRWSENLGGTWSNNPVLEDSDVWFEAVVRNAGTAATPSGRFIEVYFQINGARVAVSNIRTAGLARGASITLRANTGRDGDQFWNNVAPGTYTARAVVDPRDLMVELNNSNNGRSNTLIVEADEPGIDGSAAVQSALDPVVTATITVPFTSVIIDSNNPRNPVCKTVGDISGDGFPDIVVASNNGGGLYWYEYPSWTKRAIASTGAFATDMQVGDVDGDSDLDIIIPRVSDRTVVWYRNPRPASVTSVWTVSNIGKNRAHDVEVGDMNQDGKLDVVARGAGATVLFLQNSPTSWTSRNVNSAAGEGTALGDIDRDGDLDILQNGYWLQAPANKVTGTWTKRTIVTGYPNRVGATLADIDKDGRLDAILGPSESTGKLGWYRAPANPTTGTWTEKIIDSTVAYLHTFKAADIDNDGDRDLVTAEMHQSTNPDEVSVYHNNSGGATWTQQVVATTGSHNIRVADIGKDGDIDIIGANWSDAAPDSAVIRMWRNNLKP
jgi:CARDB/FG-GAP-like repeat